MRAPTQRQERERPWGRFGWTRPPFYTLGLLSPFFLGTFLAWKWGRAFHPAIFALALGGLFLVILAAERAAMHLGGAVANRPAHPLSGRSTTQLAGMAALALRSGGPALALAGIIGLILQFGLNTGPYTVLLGLPVILPLFTYLARPVRLVERGYGEILLAACYGWFPMALAFYLQEGYVPPLLFWIALPIGLSIFNVIVVSEFRRSTTAATDDGGNLLARLGPAKARNLVALVSILSWLSLFASLFSGVPGRAIYFYLPLLALSAFLSLLMVRKGYEAPLMLEIIRALTVAISLGTMVVYLLAFL